jgi:hypothetical protein
MDFAVPDPAGVGPGAPAMVAARGADPLVRIPPAPHFFRQIDGLVFQAVGGGLAIVADSLPLSTVTAVLGRALFIDPGAAGTAAASAVLMNDVLPTKLELVLVQLTMEPANICLNTTIRYDSLSAAAAAVQATVNQLDVTTLAAVYTLLAVDTYPLEPMAGAAPGWHAALATPPTAVTFESLSMGKGFCESLSYFAFSCFGRQQSATRDAPGTPTRVFFQQVEAFTQAEGLLRATSSLTEGALQAWFAATCVPQGLTLLFEVGTGPDRREQAIRDRHMLNFGTADRKAMVVASLTVDKPFSTQVSRVTTVLGSACSRSDARDALLRLVRCTTRSPTATVSDLGTVVTLNDALENLVHSLTAPGVITLNDRINAITRAFGDLSISAPGGGSGSGTGAPSSGGGSLRSRSDIFTDELTLALSSPAWRATETALLNIMKQPEPKPIEIHDTLMASSVLGARRLALGRTDGSLAELLKLSKPLARALTHLKSFKSIASLMFVCDLTTWAASTPELQKFRLPDRVVEALRKGAVDEIDWVKDILAPVEAAKSPNEELPLYPNGLFDPTVPQLLDPLLQRASRLLGLPLVAPPAPPPPPLPALPPTPPVFASLVTIISTVSSEWLDIVGKVSPFNDDYLADLASFESLAWEEAASLIHDELVTADNPAGRPITSVLPQNSAAMGVLSRMRRNKAANRSTAVSNPTQYQMLADYKAGKLTGTLRPRSPSLKSGTSASSFSSDGKVTPKLKVGKPTTSSKLAKVSSTVMPGSLFEKVVKLSTDGERFYFVNSANRRRKSPVYDFATLEKIAGKTREELDFVYLLSTKLGDSKMGLCRFSHLPNHKTPTSSAHVPPFSDFLDRVHQHFRKPAPSELDEVGHTRELDSKKADRRKRASSPHPGDSRRSHGRFPGQGHDRASSRSPSRESQRSQRSRSRSPGGRDKQPEPGPPRPRPASPKASYPQKPPTAPEPPASPGRQDSPSDRRGDKSPRASPKADRPSQVKPAGTSTSGSRTSGGQRASWVAGLTLDGLRGAYGAPATAGARPRTSTLIDLTLPCAAMVRTVLFVVALTADTPVQLLVPATASHVLGMVASRQQPRVAAVQSAQHLAQSLGIPGLDPALLCLPVFESIPAAGDGQQVVDRVVALPLPHHLLGAIPDWSKDHPEGWGWSLLGALTCSAVYALAAHAVARLRTYRSTSHVKVLDHLRLASTRFRSGARSLSTVKRSRDGGETPAAASSSSTCWPTVLDAPVNWHDARVRLAAGEHRLRQKVLSFVGPEPLQSDIRSFADLIRPINEEEVPACFRLPGALPSFADPALFLTPFSVRVQPPKTEWLDRKPPQRSPPAHFSPKSIGDLLTSEWFQRLADFYVALGEWLLRLAECSDDPHGEEAEAVRRARPEVLVIPRSGFVPEAQDIYWDLRGETPVPIDFRADFVTHLNLDLIRSWQLEWPGYPDREIFSHLLEGVRFKAELPYQMVMQPHLASLSLGFVNVHKELQRLVELGFFQCFTGPAFAPWFTLPNGCAFRKLEPERPRRTTDGGAPRRGRRGREWLVDADGVRVVPINTAGKWPADDVSRGTLALFTATWERRLAQGTASLPPPHLVTGLPPPDDMCVGCESDLVILVVFSGAVELPHSLPRLLQQAGFTVVCVDIVLGGEGHDLRHSATRESLKERILTGEFAFVFLAPPCKSFSIAPLGQGRGNSATRPVLRTRFSPKGVSRMPAEWASYVRRHNELVESTIELVTAADQAGVAWAIENPAHRGIPGSPEFWHAVAHQGTLWDYLAQAGIAPAWWDVLTGPLAVSGVEQVVFAACALGAPFQKLTTIWCSRDASPLLASLRGFVCTHQSHEERLIGFTDAGMSKTAGAAAYVVGVARQLAEGITATCAAVISSQALEAKRRSSSPSPSRPSVNSRPASPALRGGTIVDIDITREGPTPLLSNPFKLGPRGTTERLRPLACLHFREWLAARTVRARDWPSSLPVSPSAATRTGEDVIREAQRILDKYGLYSSFNLVCSRRCVGKLHCHGYELAALLEQMIDSSCAPPFPKELKPTVPEIMVDLAVLMHLSSLTGLLVFQMVSDVKDFFNQHRLAAEEQYKVGLVTLDPRAVIAHAAALRANEPRLCNVAEGVLGYGLFAGSNISQRTGLLLIFIWLVRMLRESEVVVESLKVQYPVINDWLSKRESHLQPAIGRDSADFYRYQQARLWTMSVYTDDGHQAFLGEDLALLGLVIWRELTAELRLTMAIIQKHGLGLQVTCQGFRFNTGLGIVFVPEDKARRTLEGISTALDSRMTLTDYHSLLGLLQSLMFVVGLRKVHAYGLYSPFVGKLSVDPEELLRVTPFIKDRLEEWQTAVGAASGTSFASAVEHLAEQAHFPESAFPTVSSRVFFLRADASKEGTVLPGVGGAMGGMLWRYPRRQPLSPRFLQLPIAVLEFVALACTLVLFGPLIPTTSLVVAETDALSTADSLTADAASSLLMQHVHTWLRARVEFQSLEHRLLVAHVFGDANVMADAISRGYYDVISSLAVQFGLVVSYREPPPCVEVLLNELVTLQCSNEPDVDAHVGVDQDSFETPNLAIDAASMHSTSVHLGLAADSIAQADHDMASAVVSVDEELKSTLPRLSSPPLPQTPLPPHSNNPSLSPVGLMMSGLSASPIPFLVSGSAISPPASGINRLSHNAPTGALSATPLGVFAAVTVTTPEVRHQTSRPSCDLRVADLVASMLEQDTSALALRPGHFSLQELCNELYDPSTAQPRGTSAGQDSAWKHWSAWCASMHHPSLHRT